MSGTQTDRPGLTAVICAAGQSRRMGFDKLTAELDGTTAVARSVALFDGFAPTERIVVGVSVGREEEFRALLGQTPHRAELVICAGGGTRDETVRRALAHVPDGGLTAVHDAARPFASPELLARVYAAAAEHGAAIPAEPVRDTIHTVRDGFLTGTPARETLSAAQTPQIFRTELLRRALERSAAEGRHDTDDAGAVLAAGGTVASVEGEEGNLKLTTPGDLRRGGIPPFRIGHGYDVHRLVEGRRLILGGVGIPFEKGLLGHSDADVLVHAAADSLLGAAALGDIGRHFPDSDPAYEGISSLILLRRVGELLRERGWRPVNLDVTVCCQRPKLAPHVGAMRANLARALEIPAESVSVKATTEEGLGFTGRGEGISASAVCLIGR